MEMPTVDQLREVWERTRVEPELIRAALQRIKPSWPLFEKPEHPGEDACYAFHRGSIQVLWSMRRELDGEVWIHVSLCGRTGAKAFFLPSYEDVQRVKHDFLGENWAYQVFPDERHYVNQHPSVLHLWARMDGSPALPDFTHGLGTI